MVIILNPVGFRWHLARRVINSYNVMVAAELCWRNACMFRKQKMAVGTSETNKTKIAAVKYSNNRSWNKHVGVLCPEDEGG
jgi:hypothetical protein